MGEPSAAVGWRSQVPALVLAAIAVGVLARAVLLALPPLFVTDVSYYNAQAAGYLLRGVDPYGASYAVPPALQTPGAENVFAYFPGVFAFIVPGGFAEGRLGLVACDLAVAGSLILARPRTGGLMSALYLLLPPVAAFSTSFLNDSLPAIAFLSAAFLFESRGKHSSAAVLFGVALASSQEAWFVFPVYLAYSLRGKRFFAPLLSLAAAAAVFAPFAAWDPSAFLSNTVLFQFQRSAAPLFSSGPFGLNVNPSLQGFLLQAGSSAPLAARALLAGAFLAVALWRVKGGMADLLRWSAASVVFCLFVLAGDFFWSYLELPFVLLLFWAAIGWDWQQGASTLKEPAPGVADASK